MSEMLIEDLTSCLLRSELTIQTLTEKIAKLEDEVSLLCEENSMLQHESDSTREVGKTNHERKLLKRLAELQKIIEELSIRWEEAQVREKVLGDLRDHLHLQNEKLSERIDMQSEDICALLSDRSALTRLRSFVEDKESAEEEAHRLRGQVHKMKIENMHLQRQLKTARQAVVRCEEEVFLRSQQIDLMRKHASLSSSSQRTELLQFAELKAELMLVQEKYELLKTKHRTLKNDRTNIVKRISEMKDAYKRIRESQLRILRNVNCLLPSGESLEMLEDDVKNLGHRLDAEEVLIQSKETSLCSYNFESGSEESEQLSEKTPSQYKTEICELQDQITGLLSRVESLSKIENTVYKYFPSTADIPELISSAIVAYQRELTSHRTRNHYSPRNVTTRSVLSLATQLLTADDKKLTEKRVLSVDNPDCATLEPQAESKPSLLGRALHALSKQKK